MTDSELLFRVRKTEWHTPLQKIVCLLLHRHKWRYFLDWETATLKSGVAACDKCNQFHVLWFGKGKKMEEDGG